MRSNSISTQWSASTTADFAAARWSSRIKLSPLLSASKGKNNVSLQNLTSCLNSASHFEIHFNAWNIYEPAESDPQRLVVNATSYVIHDQFFANAEVTLYDIAIIYLDSPISGIVPVKLPAKSDDYPLDIYLSVKAIGYGQEDGT